MTETALFWQKVGAISQAAAAAATFLAVLVSLWIAFHSRRPRLRLKVGERLILGGGQPDIRVLVFEVANAGERPVHVRGIGWRTGWLRIGPKFLRRQHAVQLTGGVGYGADAPYEIQPGDSVSSYALMDNVLAHARDRDVRPLFTRDWPLIGRRGTAIWGYAFTADGHFIHVRGEKSLCNALIAAEIGAEPQRRG